jgi:hypothetical protein
MMKLTSPFGIADVLCFFFFLMLASCASNHASEQAEEKKQQETKTRLSEMSARWNAIEWRPRFSTLLSLYTADLQEAMVRADGHPIMLYATLDDIAQRGDGYEMRFRSLLSDLPDDIYIYFELAASREQARAILGMNDRPLQLLEDFAVVAKIEDVHKVEFAVVPGYAGDPSVEIESGSAFVARGKCLEYLDVGTYGLELDASQNEGQNPGSGR